MAELRRTPLYSKHLEAGGRMVPFAGWEMPVDYGGIKGEHLAVRSGCGVFDVSHMGEIETSGPGAEALLQLLLTNDIARIEVGRAQYSCMCREDGGVLDDLFTYRLDHERYLTVTNAANHERDLDWFQAYSSGFDCQVSDRLADWAMLAVQGPAARETVGSLAGGELPARNRVAEVELAGGSTLVCGTGYTGEDGVEILIEPERAEQLWDELSGAGATLAGLGARDTLRLEVNYCLYGNELGTEHNPIEAALGWVCAESTGFIGSEACIATRELGPDELLAAFKLTGPGVPRPGNPVVIDGQPVGVVTSGTHSPSLGVGIGMAYLPAAAADPGTAIEIDVRGRVRAARVEKRPLYRPGA